MKTIHDFKVKDNGGEEISLKRYSGKPVLIVNTASECGFTPQYRDLQTLSDHYQGRIAVLGFPCNQFGGQEPGSDDEIMEFCRVNYGVTFPIFAKVDVNGDNAHPLFRFLCDACPGLMGSKRIKWNFTKFLIGPDGVPLKRFAPQSNPASITGDIDVLLNGPG